MFIRTIASQGIRFFLHWVRDPKILLKKSRTALTVLREGGLRAVAGRLEGREMGTYADWSRSFVDLSDDDRSAIRDAVSKMRGKPRISVLVVGAQGQDFDRSVASVRSQLYPEATLLDAPVPAAELLARVETEFFAILHAGDTLTEDALFIAADMIARDADFDLAYSDEDTGTIGFAKPSWSPDLLRSQNYVGGFAVFRTESARKAGGLAAESRGCESYDLALRLSEKLTMERVRSLSYVLCHRSSASEATLRAERAALERHLARIGRRGEVLPGPAGTHRVRYQIPTPAPLVSLIICTKDKVDLLRQTIEGITNNTDYPSLEIIVVNNRSAEPATFAYFEELKADPRIRIIDQDIPFNFSRLNNEGVRVARGSVIGLLNNDLEVIHPDWLREMVSHALRPEVGAVGAKLYYPENRLQHGGVILGINGVAGHAHKRAPRAEIGHGRRLVSIQNYSAVTAACIILRRDVFDQVGGLDEQNLPVAFNDIDLCLRIREQGYWLVWTPFAELYHHESASRGPDSNDATFLRFQREIHVMIRRWGEKLLIDPFYSPNLTMVAEDFAFAFPPRVAKPWKHG